ncbi:hypothetical protein [Paenibacillus sp. S150]|uniref:hypothetical protein n=1 Tax=Paenibacillus sp. S150 TaxID=2749826 RepID=UPI001C57E910|nr:hypothetical protein [Paenibacillus sp. S150]MBW4082667.1 hypothetical protein [Paenibacillus sp. S150]
MLVTETDVEAFEENYRDALGYHRRAEQFLRQKQRFSLVFNVGSVALERYLVALCHLYGVMPLNHNYICLMNAVETVVDVPKELNKEIRSLDFIFGICSLDDYFHGTPKPEDSIRVLTMCEQVRQLFDQTKISLARAAYVQG